jgi:hypothetical protein
MPPARAPGSRMEPGRVAGADARVNRESSAYLAARRGEDGAGRRVRCRARALESRDGWPAPSARWSRAASAWHRECRRYSRRRSSMWATLVGREIESRRAGGVSEAVATEGEGSAPDREVGREGLLPSAQLADVRPRCCCDDLIMPICVHPTVRLLMASAEPARSASRGACSTKAWSALGTRRSAPSVPGKAAPRPATKNCLRSETSALGGRC